MVIGKAACYLSHVIFAVRKGEGARAKIGTVPRPDVIGSARPEEGFPNLKEAPQTLIASSSPAEGGQRAYSGQRIVVESLGGELIPTLSVLSLMTSQMARCSQTDDMRAVLVKCAPGHDHFQISSLSQLGATFERRRRALPRFRSWDVVPEKYRDPRSRVQSKECQVRGHRLTPGSSCPTNPTAYSQRSISHVMALSLRENLTSEQMS